MALSLLYNPVDYSSAHGDLIFTLLEDTKPFASNLYPDYKYVCDVYIGGTLAARLKSFPRPGDKIGVFNIGNILRNYFSNAFDPVPNNIRSNQFGENVFYVNAICRFGEEYGNVTYSNIIIDTQRSYFNNYNGRLFGEYTSLTGYQDKIMSTRPYKTKILKDSRFCFLPFFATDDTTINVIIRKYNGATLISTLTLPTDPIPGSSNTLQLFNASPSAINGHSAGFINDFVEYYTVEFNTTNITGDSIYRFDVICECKYDPFDIHFLNKFGGWESRSFTKVSRRSLDIEKNEYGKAGYFINSSGAPVYFGTNKVYNETRSIYAAGWKEKMILNTDILTDDEYAWLGEMMLSPLAYIEMNDYFFPIVIAGNNYEPKKVINDDLTNLTINIEFGDRFNTQYR